MWQVNRIILLTFLLLFQGLCQGHDQSRADRVCSDTGCLQIKIFKSNGLTDSPKLVFSIHGDAPFGRPSYHYRFAQRIALESRNTVAIGILRPGYTDDFNRTSDGERGETVGDSYDDGRVLHIAEVIRSLTSTLRPETVILAGHSGGAAISAKLIAMQPELADVAFVVSCPCDINAWRADMYERNAFEGFLGDLEISSPVDLVRKISPKTRVYVYVGRQDDITRPHLSRQYHRALLDAGKTAELFTIDGNHEVFLSEPVVQGVLRELKR